MFCYHLSAGKQFIRWIALSALYTTEPWCFVLAQVPEVFVSSLVQDGQPQFLTTITIQVTKLTQPQEFVVSKPLFLDKTCTFGMLTTKRVPWVSTWLLIFHLLSSNSIEQFSIQCRSVIGPENLNLSFSRSAAKLKPITTWSSAFSRALGSLVVLLWILTSY